MKARDNCTKLYLKSSYREDGGFSSLLAKVEDMVENINIIGGGYKK